METAMIRNCGRLIGLLIFASGYLIAADYRWTNAVGDGDWTNPQNFEAGGVVPSRVPDSSDTVTISDDTTVSLSYDVADEVKMRSCEVFGGVARIIPEGDASVVDITVPGNQRLVLACAIVNSASALRGLLIKRGEGELDLSSYGKVKVSSDFYDYYTNFEILDGVLKFPQDVSTEDALYGVVTVRKPGVLFTGNVCKSLKSNDFVGLYGDGTITNSHWQACGISVRNYGEFAGVVSGMNSFTVRGFLQLLGSDSIACGDSVTVRYNYGYGARPAHGCIGITKFGMKRTTNDETVERMPSSIGFAEAICIRDNGGAVAYLGNGETTDKDLQIWNPGADYPAIIDAGANGGLVWNGVWGLRNSDYSTANHSLARLVITGSNKTECVMNGVIETRRLLGTNYNICITKEGTGKWRVNNNTNGNMTGVWQIREGTLAFDSIAETNINSALGKSTLLYQDFAGKPSDDRKVGHAIVLGGGTTRGDLEYVGTTNCISTTRLFAVDGVGAVVNNGDGKLVLSGFESLKGCAGGSTLVLGGANEMENVANDICDGVDGCISLHKEGTGSWTVGGESLLSGGISVSEGRLAVSRPRFTWFRWEIVSRHENGDTGTNARTVSIDELALYDAEGNRINTGMTERCLERQDGNNRWCVPLVETTDFFGGESVRSLQPNEASILETDGYRCYYGANKYYPLANVLDGGDGFVSGLLVGKSIIMRLAEGAPAVKYWDWCHYASNGRSVREMRLYGSEGGRVWHLIGSRVSDWSDVEGNDGFAYPHGTGMWEYKRVKRGNEIAGVQPGIEITVVPSGAATAFARVSSVAVAKGAELCVEGAALDVPKIFVNVAGMGAIRGVALSDGGTIDIVGGADRGDFTVSVDFTGVVLPERYSFTVNGKWTNRSVRLSEDRKSIFVTTKGLAILLR